MNNTTDQFERALGEILARVFHNAGKRGAMPSAAVAFSGGLDSTALLHMARACSVVRGVRLFAFHVHHGLSSNADEWLSHCERECARLGIVFDSRRVAVRRDTGHGVESAARTARYAALGEMCRAHRVPLLLTAHHLNDQAETVLLQLLRGAGVAGLSGMDALGIAPDLLGGDDVTLARPLLSITRVDLERYLRAAGVDWIDDESNTDPRFARNALRQRVAPVLETHFPGFSDRVARSAQHAQFAQRLLNELAREDFEACRKGDDLNAARMRKLSGDRASNLLRHWLGLHGLRMPSAAWLHEALAQLLGTRADAQVCVALEASEIRRHRNRIVFLPVSNLPKAELERAFKWQGESVVPVPEFGGVLHFEPAEQGVDAEWLRAQPLFLRGYRGEARLKLAADRPSKSLKSYCQELGIPAWERRRLLLLYAGHDLLFAADIGQDCRIVPVVSGGIKLRWSAD